MSGEIDAVGGLVTGSMVAHAVDKTGSAGELQSACPNCDTPITGNFCSNCGQHAHIPRSIGHIFEELAHGILHLDGKAWRTLPMLAFQPGRLTREYIEGKRKRYIAPFALFLFTIFLMYFTFAMIGTPELPAGGIQVDEKSLAQLEVELAEERAELETLEKRAAEIAARPNLEPGEGAGLAGEIAGQKVSVSVIESALEQARKAAAAQKEAPPAAAPAPAPNRTNAEVGDGNVIVPGLDIKELMTKAAEKGDITIVQGADTLNQKVRDALRNPDFFFYKMQQSAYKFAFLLVPLSLPFVWLLFPFRRSAHLYDHAIFTLYSISFMSMLLVVAAVLSATGLVDGGSAAQAAILIPPVHMFVQLKGAYRLGWFGALVRTLLLSLFAIIVLAIFFLIILGLGALG